MKLNKRNEVIAALADNMKVCQEALNEELGKIALAETIEDIMESTPSDISSRYWLMQVLEPLKLKELQSIVNGFLIQLLTDEQALKLVKFILLRFPEYNRTLTNLPGGMASDPASMQPQQEQIAASKRR